MLSHCTRLLSLEPELSSPGCYYMQRHAEASANQIASFAHAERSGACGGAQSFPSKALPEGQWRGGKRSGWHERCQHCDLFKKDRLPPCISVCFPRPRFHPPPSLPTGGGESRGRRARSRACACPFSGGTPDPLKIDTPDAPLVLMPENPVALEKPHDSLLAGCPPCPHALSTWSKMWWTGFWWTWWTRMKNPHVTLLAGCPPCPPPRNPYFVIFLKEKNSKWEV